MARQKLGALLSVASDQGSTPTAPPAAPTPSPAPQTEAPNTTRAPAPRKPAKRAARAVPSKAPATAHWTEYERLEARLRDAQVEQLDALIRRINKRRAGAGERITKNTLLRVAVDLLLERQDELAGSTEAEILDALH